MNNRGRRPDRNPVARRRLEHSPFNKDVDLPPDEVYAVGDRVNHDRYGLGAVVAVEGTEAVIIDFGADTRRIAIPNPKLTRI